jgi:hypothetical protein
LLLKCTNLVCFVTMRSPKPWCFMSRSWYLRKALDD